jgi:predicted Zn-dependent protease
MRVAVYLAAKHWELALAVAETVVELLPGDLYGWIHRSFALHELKRTAEAQEKLKPAAKKFPKQHLVFYNLACYACQLGEMKNSLQLLGEAIDLAGKKDIRLMAMEDPDLEPLWKDIAET